MDATYKVAHMIYWWPRIQAHLDGCKPSDCWWVPTPIRDAIFRKVELPPDVEDAAAAQKAI